eukprot:1609672-Rhodomonas_salina.1
MSDVVCGTDVAFGATRPFAVCGTDVAYGATRSTWTPCPSGARPSSASVYGGNAQVQRCSASVYGGGADG